MKPIQGNDRTARGDLRPRLTWPWIGTGYILGVMQFTNWPGLFLGLLVWFITCRIAITVTRRPIQAVNLRRKDGTAVYLVLPTESAEVLLGEDKS